MSTTRFTANLNVMMKAARAAGRALVRDFGEIEKLQVRSKSAGDFVSRADIRAEEVIRTELLEARPNYGWLGEESGEKPGPDPTRRWIVDPLDGTTNFLHGLPHWCVSIALEQKGEIVSAVIFDPTKQEMFVAEKGVGAWLNDQRIRVSDRTELLECVFATGVPFGAKAGLPSTLQQIARVSPVTAGIRRWGAAALDLAYVAAGRYEGFWETGLHPWDVAAGTLIAREAGGLVEALGGETTPHLAQSGIIAANGVIFDRFAALIRDR